VSQTKPDININVCSNQAMLTNVMNKLAVVSFVAYCCCTQCWSCQWWLQLESMGWCQLQWQWSWLWLWNSWQ